MLDYLLSQYATLGRAFLEHLWMVAVVLGLSLAAAAVLTVTAMYSRVWSAFLVNLFSVITPFPAWRCSPSSARAAATASPAL